MISAKTLVTLRRRVVDKVCKDPIFLKDVLGVAIETGAIKHTDLLEAEDVQSILQAPERGATTTS